MKTRLLFFATLILSMIFVLLFVFCMPRTSNAEGEQPKDKHNQPGAKMVDDGPNSRGGVIEGEPSNVEPASEPAQGSLLPNPDRIRERVPDRTPGLPFRMTALNTSGVQVLVTLQETGSDGTFTQTTPNTQPLVWTDITGAIPSIYFLLGDSHDARLNLCRDPRSDQPDTREDSAPAGGRPPRGEFIGLPELDKVNDRLPDRIPGSSIQMTALNTSGVQVLVTLQDPGATNKGTVAQDLSGWYPPGQYISGSNCVGDNLSSCEVFMPPIDGPPSKTAIFMAEHGQELGAVALVLAVVVAVIAKNPAAVRWGKLFFQSKAVVEGGAAAIGVTMMDEGTNADCLVEMENKSSGVVGCSGKISTGTWQYEEDDAGNWVFVPVGVNSEEK